MKRFYLNLLMLIAWLIAAPLNAAIWSPTWTWQKMSEHVAYQDHSTNCTASKIYLMDTNGSNDFKYYVYKSQNTEDNVGYVNVDYFLLDKVTITESSSYTFSMKAETNWDYVNLRNAKMKVQLRDGTTSDSKVLCELGEVDLYFNGKGSAKTKSLTFGSAATEGYICLTFTGELIGSIYSCTFSNFSIEKETSSEVPVIIEQPTTSLNIDVEDVPTLSVTAIGENLSYSWYYQFPGSTWISLDGEDSSSFKPTYFYAGYKYKCVVSNSSGDASTNTISVDHITLHGTEYPEGSGKYYATYTSSEDFSTDAQTVAYKAVWDEEKEALRLVHVRQDDASLPKYSISKGVLLESISPDIVISVPETYTYTNDYTGNTLLDHWEYNKTNSYVLGVRDGKIAMYPGTEDAIPFYEACYNSDGTEYPDGVDLLFPAQYTIVFDKNADNATGTMAAQTLFDDGNTQLFANAFTRTKWDFIGWSTSPTGETEYADKQLITTIPATTDNTLTLYAQWQKMIDEEGNYIINNSDTWASFCQYVNNTDNSINAKLTADITTAVTEMVGTSDKPYMGTLDGGGHVLTIGYVNAADATGPFRYTKGATIQDLTVRGTIATSKKFAGGLIGVNQSGSSNQTTLLRCVSNVNIVSSVSGDGTHGGLVGVNYGDDMVIETCAFAGSLTQATNYTTSCCGGFVGWSDGTTVLRNCLLAASLDVDTDGSNTFVRNNATLTNCHYTTTLGVVPDGATSIADKNLSNGEALVSLGSTWAQILGSDDIPRPYRESEKETINYIYNDGNDWVCEDFQLEDKKEVNIGLDFTAKELSYNRPFTIDDGYYTVYAPFAIPTTNGDLYACTGINAEKTEAEFTEVASPEANTAYIFKPARTQLDLGSNVEVKKTSDLTSSTGYLRGVYSLFTFTNDNKEGCYGYAAEAKNGYEAGAFVKFGAGATVPAGRAYIYAPDVSSNNPLKVVINGETTSISLPISNTSGAPVYYNLSGQRVSNDYKGIVISNGKKAIRK